MEPIETSENNGFKVRIYVDEEPSNPREDDNLGVMVCWHQRYRLGDRQLKPEEYPSVPAIEESLIADGAVVILPLYLYDHGGLTMRTSSFADRWDSGQVGFIYVTEETLRHEYSWPPGQPVPAETLDLAKEVLEGEVKTYDQYLSGDVYGWVLLDPQGQVLDSCGDYFSIDACREEAKAAAEGHPIQEEQTAWVGDPILLIPDPEPGQQYPADIEPGYYTVPELVELLRNHKHTPEAIQFIADMLEP